MENFTNERIRKKTSRIRELEGKHQELEKEISRKIKNREYKRIIKKKSDGNHQETV